MQHLLIKILIVFFFSMHSFVFAEEINIKADKLIVLKDKNYLEFIGNVKAKQDGNIINADKIFVYQKELNGKNIIERIVAKKNVEIKTKDNRYATSDYAEYIKDKRLFIFIGENAQITDEKNNIIKGNKIKYYQESGEIVAEGKKAKQMEVIIKEKE